MNNIIDIIDKKLVEINNYTIDTKDVDYLKKFEGNLFKLIECNDIEVITAFLMANLKKSYNEVIKIVNANKDYIEDILSMDAHDIIDFCEAIYQGTCDIEGIEDMSLDDFLNLKLKDHNYKVTLKFFKQTIKDNGKVKTNTLFKILTNKDYRDIIAFMGNLHEFKESVDEYTGENFDKLVEEQIEKNSNIRPQDMKKIVKMSTNKALEFINNRCEKLLENYLKTFNDYKVYLSKKVLKEEREKNYLIRDYTNLKNELLHNTLDIEKLKKYDIDPYIYNIALDEIIKNRNKEFKSIYETLSYYRENDINKLEVLFLKNGYNFNLLSYVDQEELNSIHDIKEIEDKLKFLKTSSLKNIKENDKSFIKLLLLNKELLEVLDTLVIRKRISHSFILNNSNLIDSVSIKRIIENINKLEELKIDFEKLNKYNDTIINSLDYELLEEIKSYNIKCESNNTNIYSFLEDKRLLLVIDMFIELGLIDIIKNNPNLISVNSINVIKRINIMDSLNEKYINNHGTLNQDVYKGKNFYISDDDLDKYLYINYSNYMNQEIKNILDNSDMISRINEIPDEISFISYFDNNDGTYRIGDLIFSKNKVLRSLNILYNSGYTNYKEMLFNSLIYSYPKYLSDNDITLIKESIFQVKKIKNL